MPIGYADIFALSWRSARGNLRFSEGNQIPLRRIAYVGPFATD
jgi:hypothetical protein